MKSPYIIVTGPTGSGKTALAFALARAFSNRHQKTVLINGDSMQLYADLHILTARPTMDEKKQAPDTPYLLDGILTGDERSSSGFWMRKAVEAIKDAWIHHAIPIVVGGTGLYLKALMEGIAPIPDIPKAIQKNVRSMHHLSLSEMIDMMSPTFKSAHDYKDPQRLLRAFEVFCTTGKSMEDFFGKEERPLDVDPILVVLNPQRERLYQSLDQRFLDMIKDGAIDEIKGFMELHLPVDHPLYKATGVTPLMNFLKGNLSKDQAIALGQQHTRQYAKRQRTWMKNQFSPNLLYDPFQESIEIIVDAILNLMGDFHKII